MGRHASPSRRRRRWLWLLAGALTVVLVASVLTRLSTSGDSPLAQGTKGGCSTLKVATSPSMLDVVQAQARAATDGCRRMQVVALEPQAFGAALSTGKDVPDVWIPDSGLWVASVQKALQGSGTATTMTDRGAVASSPVVMAVPASIATEQNTGVKPWLSVLSGSPLAVSPPGDSTPTVLAFASVWQTLANNPVAQSVMGSAFFQVVRSAVPPDALIAFADKPADQARIFPASEQQIFAYNREHPKTKLSAVVPESGPPVMELHFVDVGTHDAARKRSSDALLRHLRSEAGIEEFTRSGLRAGTVTKELVPGIPVKLPGNAAEIRLEEFDRLRLDWNRISRDLRLLVAVDVSGSMKEQVGQTTRAALAAEAVGQSVAQMPPTSQAGLWIFSTAQQPGADYRELVPVAPLGDAADPASHRNALLGNASRIPTLLQGDTGLYDTIWAAYQEQQRTYQPGLESLVVVITDGRNDDPPGGLSMEQLVANLQGAKDPARPVRLVLMGMGPDVDTAAMAQVSAAVDGQTETVADPAELVGRFADAVWQLTPEAWSVNG